MSGIDRIPIRVPDVITGEWMRQFIREYLAPLDTRNSVGDGVAISSTGNSPATLSVSDAIDTAIGAHDALATAHDAAFDVHRAETDPHPDLIDDLATATAVAEADYVLISQGGTNKKVTVDQLATAIFGEDWDDLRFPMSSVDPVGLAAPATRVTDTAGYTGALSFAGNAENVCAGVAQMPHAWKRGTAIRPHIHWTKPTGSANAVDWRLYLRVVGNPGDTVGAWSSALTPAGTVGDQTVSDEHLLTYWDPFAMTGLIESAIVYWRLHRLGNTDADNTAVICHELDFHYQTDKAGTEEAIPSA